MAAAKKDGNMAAAFFCAAAFAALAGVLAVPAANAVFRAATASSPLAMGFVKFALLATAGEIIAGRISCGRWSFPNKVLAKAAVWGLIGAALAFLLKVYAAGTAAVMAGNGVFVTAFATSVIMNVTFAPVMMGFHKMTAVWLSPGATSRALADVTAAVDWQGFVSFTLLKTIPFFWIPAHTVTFLLPDEYRTAMAAVLSIALGVILSLKKNG